MYNCHMYICIYIYMYICIYICILIERGLLYISLYIYKWLPGFGAFGAFGACGACGFFLCIIETAGFRSNMVCFDNANGIQVVDLEESFRMQ